MHKKALRVLAIVVSGILITVPSFSHAQPLQDVDTLESRPEDPWLNTDSCPFALTPPPAVDTSEVPQPGKTTPTPLPPSNPAPGLDFCGTEGVRADTTAGAWIIYDTNSGDVLGAKDPNGRYRPASIIKVLLALEAIDNLAVNQVIPVSETAQNTEGSSAGITTEGTYTTEDLLMGLLLHSGNDTAVALAEALGGVDVTITKMQALAETLGTENTRVASINGLDAPGMQTTATDMARIYKAAFHNPEFRKVVNTKVYDFPGSGETPSYQITNDNKLLQFDYPGTIGGKTGFTDDARHTFSAAVQRDGRELGVIILNASIVDGPAWQQAECLFDAAFAQPNSTPIGQLFAPDQIVEELSSDTDVPAHKKDNSTRNGILWMSLGLAIVVFLALLNTTLQRSASSKRSRRY